MRKFVTVLMMIAMLTMPQNMAFAVKSGSASGENKGGYDANISLEQAVARPAFFVTISLLFIIVMTTLFAPKVVVEKPSNSVLLILAMTGTLTTAYFLYVMTELYRYIVYQVLLPLPYFSQYSVGNWVNSQRTEAETETEDDIWKVSDSEAYAAALKKEEIPPTVVITDEEAAIDRAVERALRDPKLAEKYLEFASPKVREAVRNALDNQFEDRVRNRYSVEEGSGGDFEALEVQ